MAYAKSEGLGVQLMVSGTGLKTVAAAGVLAAAVGVAVGGGPWRRSGRGVVWPNGGARLGGVAVSEPSFSLDPGASKDFTVTLGGVPASGYLYGALEVVGVPADIAKRKGVVAG